MSAPWRIVAGLISDRANASGVHGAAPRSDAHAEPIMLSRMLCEVPCQAFAAVVDFA